MVLWYGRTFIAVRAMNTSRLCGQCGSIHSRNRKSQALFKCKDCGFEANAVGSVNAAENIRRQGTCPPGQGRKRFERTAWACRRNPFGEANAESGPGRCGTLPAPDGRCTRERDNPSDPGLRPGLVRHQNQAGVQIPVVRETFYRRSGHEHQPPLRPVRVNPFKNRKSQARAENIRRQGLALWPKKEPGRAAGIPSGKQRRKPEDRFQHLCTRERDNPSAQGQAAAEGQFS